MTDAKMTDAKTTDAKTTSEDATTPVPFNPLTSPKPTPSEPAAKPVETVGKVVPLDTNKVVADRLLAEARAGVRAGELVQAGKSALKPRNSMPPSHRARKAPPSCCSNSRGWRRSASRVW